MHQRRWYAGTAACHSGTDIHPGYNTGFGGAIGFLLRLRHGGPRPWMLDELLNTEKGKEQQ